MINEKQQTKRGKEKERRCKRGAENHGEIGSR